MPGLEIFVEAHLVSLMDMFDPFGNSTNYRDSNCDDLVLAMKYDLVRGKNKTTATRKCAVEQQCRSSAHCTTGHNLGSPISKLLRHGCHDVHDLVNNCGLWGLSLYLSEPRPPPKLGHTY